MNVECFLIRKRLTFPLKVRRTDTTHRSQPDVKGVKNRLTRPALDALSQNNEYFLITKRLILALPLVRRRKDSTH